MNTEPLNVDGPEGAALDSTDQVVLDALREIYEAADPVPPRLVDRVKFALTLDDLEAEVARLQRESVPELSYRSEDLHKARTVTFASDTVSTMVTITAIPNNGVRLDGWAAPGAFLDVELRVGVDRHHVVADGDGRFVFEDVGHGLAQLVLRPASPGPGERPVITPAIEI